MAATYKRRNYFVNKEVQVRFAATLVFISLLTSLQLVAYIAFADNNLVAKAAKYGLTQNELMFSFIIVQQKDLLTKLLIYLVANMFLVGLFGLFFSHRLTGPIYRLEKFIKRIAEGDLSGNVKLRKSDQFQSFATSVNTMVDCLRQKRSDELEMLKSLEKQVNGMNGKSDDVLKLIASLRRQCEAELYSNAAAQTTAPAVDPKPAAS